MHEMKVFDGNGVLKRVDSKEKCLKQYWREFEDVTIRVHDEESLKAAGGILVPGLNRSRTTEKVCKFCKEKYMGKANTKYCPDRKGLEDSKQCRNMYYANIRACTGYEDRVCVRCEKVYKPKNSSQKLCHSPCKRKRETDSKKHKYKCVICYKTFHSKMPRRLAQYCHNPCNRTLMVTKRSQKAKAGKDDKLCVSCGCSMEHLHGRRVFCGDPCSSALYEKKLNDESLNKIRAEKML